MTPKYKALIQKLDSGPVGNPSADANNSQTRQIMKEAAAALRSYSDPAPALAADPVHFDDELDALWSARISTLEDAITALRAENAALRKQLAEGEARGRQLEEAISHTAEQALASEIPVGYGPEDKGAWTQGYDAAIRHARRAKARGDAT